MSPRVSFQISISKLYMNRVWDIYSNFLIHHYLIILKGNHTKFNFNLIHFKGILSFTTYGAFVFIKPYKCPECQEQNQFTICYQKPTLDDNNPIPIFKMIIKRSKSISYRFWSNFDKIELIELKLWFEMAHYLPKTSFLQE